MIVATLALSLVLPVHSWYDHECCSDTDCRPVLAEDLDEVEPGVWKYLPTGNMFRGPQVRPSRDANFHVCIGASGTSYCVYVQSGT